MLAKKAKKHSKKKVKRSVKLSSPKTKHVKRTSKKAVKQTSNIKQVAKKAKNIVSKRGKFNLLVSFNPNHMSTAQTELATVLQKIGEKPKISNAGVDGLFKAAVSDARKVVSRLRNLCQADPNLFSAPIDVWCKSELIQMKKHIKLAALGISKDDKWKMGLNKRNWKKMEGGQLIVKLTDVIDSGNVDLDNPQKIVQVEIIGNETGVSLLEPTDILDVEEVKTAT
jgi:tRNA acetyltransferase TAN1